MRRPRPAYSLAPLSQDAGEEPVRSKHEKGGRPPVDAVLMFKILVLQALYTLSDDQMEYQMRDRLSFMRFLGLDLPQRIPDAKTIWLFRETLAQAGVVAMLFTQCDT